MLNIQLLILVELFDAFLEECLFHGIVSMGVEKNRSAMLPIPHQNGIVHQTELIRLSVETFTDLAIIGDVSEELLIPIIRQIIMIPSEQNLLTFKLRDQCDECFVSTPHGHIPKNINGIAVGDLGVPMLKDILVHFSHGGERSPVIVHTLTRLIPVEEMEVSNEVVHQVLGKDTPTSTGGGRNCPSSFSCSV